MPLAPGEDALATYTLYIGEEIGKTHSYSDWLAKRGLTATAITASMSDSSIATVTTEATTGGVWSGEISAVSAGTTNLVLTLTASGRVKKTVFKYIVRDAKSV